MEPVKAIKRFLIIETNLALVLVFVSMLVAVHQRFVSMGVLVNEVGLEYKFRVEEEIFGLAVCYYGMLDSPHLRPF